MEFDKLRGVKFLDSESYYQINAHVQKKYFCNQPESGIKLYHSMAQALYEVIQSVALSSTYNKKALFILGASSLTEGMLTYPFINDFEISKLKWNKEPHEILEEIKKVNPAFVVCPLDHQLSLESIFDIQSEQWSQFKNSTFIFFSHSCVLPPKPQGVLKWALLSDLGNQLTLCQSAKRVQINSYLQAQTFYYSELETLQKIEAYFGNPITLFENIKMGQVCEALGWKLWSAKNLEYINSSRLVIYHLEVHSDQLVAFFTKKNKNLANSFAVNSNSDRMHSDFEMTSLSGCHTGFLFEKWKWVSPALEPDELRGMSIVEMDKKFNWDEFQRQLALFR